MPDIQVPYIQIPDGVGGCTGGAGVQGSVEGCGLLWWPKVVGDGVEGGRGEHRSGVDRFKKTLAGVDRIRKTLTLCHFIETMTGVDGMALMSSYSCCNPTPGADTVSQQFCDISAPTLC